MGFGDLEEANLDHDWKKGKGGFKACTFIFVLTSLENMGFIANMASLYLYFHGVMHFDIPNSANTLTNFMGSTFLLTTLAAFISDTYLNRLSTVLIFGLLETLALIMMTLQAKLNSLHPKDCGRPTCVEDKVALMFYGSLCLLALGAGGVRGALPSLGADQFDQDDPEEAKSLGSYFNWITLVTVLGAAVGVTGVVYLSMNKGWYKGFIVSTVAAFVGLVVLAAGKPFYRLRMPGDSPILSVIQVFVLAIKNRKSPLPDKADELFEIKDKIYVDKKIAHTDQFRWLDRAAIPPKDASKYYGGPDSRGRVCTVTQVEEVKILTRMLPIICSTIIMNTCLAQLQTFSVQQGSTMQLQVAPHFKVPPASIPIIPLLFMTILIPLYELLFVPFARRITGHPSGITELQRVGIGLVLSVISMGVAGIVEVQRRNQAIKDKDHPISVFWLSFQYGIFGIADMFTLVGLMEFFYKEAPSGMKSLSTSFTWLSVSLGYFFSSILVEIINAVTKMARPSKQGWINGLSLNLSKLDLFYWFLAVISFLNFLNYLYWASWYKYKSTAVDFESSPNNKPVVVDNNRASFGLKEEISTEEGVLADHNEEEISHNPHAQVTTTTIDNINNNNNKDPADASITTQEISSDTNK